MEFLAKVKRLLAFNVTFLVIIFVLFTFLVLVWNSEPLVVCLFVCFTKLYFQPI